MITAIMLLIGLMPGLEMRAKSAVMLIDDFSSTDGRSALGTEWRGFTDRVMGGRSDIQAGFETVDGQQILALSGSVRLDNNGGFIQVRLPLAANGRSFDATRYHGFRIDARGWISRNCNRLPWSPTESTLRPSFRFGGSS